MSAGFDLQICWFATARVVHPKPKIIPLFSKTDTAIRRRTTVGENLRSIKNTGKKPSRPSDIKNSNTSIYIMNYWALR
jgi:hypothetical protein